MKYIVVGKSAVLGTRNIERIDDNRATNVRVINVPDGATILFIGDDVRSYSITSESTAVNFFTFPKGTYKVAVNWTTKEDGNTVSHEAFGNSIKIATDSNGDYIVPAPISSGAEVENMWQAISDILNVLIPLEDNIMNGVNVI